MALTSDITSAEIRNACQAGIRSLHSKHPLACE